MGIKNFFSKQLERLIEGNVVHPRNTFYAIDIPRTRYDYQKEVGTGLGSNVIMSPIQWVMRTFPEAKIAITKMSDDGSSEPIIKHPFLDLINKPNDFYSYETMIMATMLSWSISGNAYWLKIRNDFGQVIQLWYVPHWMISPKGHDTDMSIFVDHYQYSPNGQIFIVRKEDVIHFRFGLNPKNLRMGLSPLDAVIREVFTDDEASNYSASLMRNMGIPGVIISPDSDEGIDVETAKGVKEKFKETFTGDRRGESMVMTGKTKIEMFGFDPNKLDLSRIRDISEERVCAALGIPAAVVGFGAGLQTTKVGATMTALIKLAWTANIIPSQRPIAETLNRQLLKEFDDDPMKKIIFDNSNISALQEDKDAVIKRLTDGVRAGWATIADVRLAEGLPVDDSHRVFLRPITLIEVEE